MYSTFVRSYFVKGIKLLRELMNSNRRFKAFATVFYYYHDYFLYIVFNLLQDAKQKCKRLDLSDLLLMPVQVCRNFIMNTTLKYKCLFLSSLEIATIRPATRSMSYFKYIPSYYKLIQFFKLIPYPFSFIIFL